MLTNQSSDTYISLYRFRREGNNKIINKQETSFYLWPNSVKNQTYNIKTGNHRVIYYEIELTENDLDFEYAIGRSSNDNVSSSGFYYMMLAGTDTQGNTPMEGTGKVLEKMDFVSATTLVKKVLPDHLIPFINQYWK